MHTHLRWLLFAAALLALGCRSGNEADRVGVAAECTQDSDCPEIECESDPCPALECLTQFSGGYCGLADCVNDLDCPQGSACVIHPEGATTRNYCFRLCDIRSECNVNRTFEFESNCSSNVVFVDPQTQRACVPPSSG